MEDRLGQGVEVGEDLAALGAEGVGVVEDRRDPPLLPHRWKRDLQIGEECRWDTSLTRTPRHTERSHLTHMR